MIEELVKQVNSLQKQIDALIKPEVSRNNFVAAVGPAVTDDRSSGYTIGSLWIDIVADDAYICCDSTLANAVWKKITP